MSERFRDRQGSQSMKGYRLPEPAVDTIANAISRVRSRVWLSGGYSGDANILADEVERLQAELEKERRLHGMARSTISSRTAEVERLQAPAVIDQWKQP